MMITNVFYIVILENLKMLLLIIYLELLKRIAKEIIDECNMDFENVSLDELDKIEKLLEVNVHIFGCNKKLNSKKLLKNQIQILIKI